MKCPKHYLHRFSFMYAVHELERACNHCISGSSVRFRVDGFKLIAYYSLFFRPLLFARATASSLTLALLRVTEGDRERESSSDFGSSSSAGR
eukprot:1045801-Amphidinium_carterae.1